MIQDPAPQPPAADLPPALPTVDPNSFDQDWSSALVAVDISGGPGAEVIVAEGEAGDAPALFRLRRLRESAPELQRGVVVIYRRQDMERWSSYAALLARWDDARKPRLISGGVPAGTPEVFCSVQQGSQAVNQRLIAQDLILDLHRRAPRADMIVQIEDCIREHLNRFPGP